MVTCENGHGWMDCFSRDETVEVSPSWELSGREVALRVKKNHMQITQMKSAHMNIWCKCLFNHGALGFRLHCLIVSHMSSATVTGKNSCEYLDPIQIHPNKKLLSHWLLCRDVENSNHITSMVKSIPFMFHRLVVLLLCGIYSSGCLLQASFSL